MVKSNPRNLFIALFLIAAATIALAVMQPGGFSVTGVSDNYARDDGNDAGFREAEDVRCSDPMECEPSTFNPADADCTAVDVSSVSSAAEELGVDEYFSLTQDHSLTEINGVVYACK